MSSLLCHHRKQKKCWINSNGFYFFLVGLAAPLNAREGNVTDTSIEIAWDRADGDFQGYEVTCTNCASAFRVCFLNDHLCVDDTVIFFKVLHKAIRG